MLAGGQRLRHDRRLRGDGQENVHRFDVVPRQQVGDVGAARYLVAEARGQRIRRGVGARTDGRHLEAVMQLQQRGGVGIAGVDAGADDAKPDRFPCLVASHVTIPFRFGLVFLGQVTWIDHACNHCFAGCLF